MPTITGTSASEVLTGFSTDDTLNGGLGTDTLIGGFGNDVYITDGGDVIVEVTNGGVDTVQSSTFHVLDKNIENLLLTGSASVSAVGNTLDNQLTGNVGNNRLDGLSGNDTLSGAGGSDTLVGGEGNDTYIVSGNEILIEEDNQGVDTVRAPGTYFLGSNLENLISINQNINSSVTLVGNIGNNEITGGLGRDTMYGDAGNDTIRADHEGTDFLFGGVGDDAYYVSWGDIITEEVDQGIDTAFVSSRTYDPNTPFTLSLNLENFQLVFDSDPTSKFFNRYTIKGNELNNILKGSDGRDSIEGGDGNDLLEGGGGTDTLFGGSGDDTLDGSRGETTMFGGPGNDIYIIDDASDVATEAERPLSGIDTVWSSVDHTIGARIENLVLTEISPRFGNGNELSNSITGNAASNVLGGAGGSDSLFGGDGNDTLDGGSGDDFIDGGNGDDTVWLNAARSSVSIEHDSITNTFTVVSANGTDRITQVEFFQFIDGTLSSSLFADNNALPTGIVRITGNATQNSSLTVATDSLADLEGLGPLSYQWKADGADIIGAVTGTLLLGQSLVGRAISVEVRYTDGAGRQEVVLSAATSAVQNVNDLPTGAVTISGTAREDSTLTAVTSAIADADGLGAFSYQWLANGTPIAGATASTLTLGQAQVGQAITVQVRFMDGQGTAESLVSAATLTVQIGTNIQRATSFDLPENGYTVVLTLTGTGNINGTGNALANVLTGNAGNNVLNGGVGNDTLIGGAGNDTHVVNAKGDRVFETTTTASAVDAGGIDMVQSAVSFSLDASAGVRFVERLTLTGTGNINGTGNALANVLTGNVGNNVLNGGVGNDTLIGGAGNDTLIGGAGNDTHVVNAKGDRVFETTTTASAVDAGGIDTVQSAVSFSLDANAGVRFVERLTLTGTGNINGTGNALANVLTGNAGNNVLNGGLGNDTLIGGAGNDTFVFNTALGAGNIDRINDFNVAEDTIRLDDLVFVGLATKTLAASAFAANLTGTATDALDRIIYETDTGRLYFDADGSGSGARVLFATLTPNLALTHADFFVF